MIEKSYQETRMPSQWEVPTGFNLKVSKLKIINKALFRHLEENRQSHSSVF